MSLIKKFLFTLLIVTFSMSVVFCQTDSKEIPKELHDFWQFKVDKRGNWNGLHIGSNYVEYFYDLAKINSVIQKGNHYTISLNFPNRRNANVNITLLDKDKATIEFIGTNKTLHCQRFDKDPDIELLSLNNYKKAINGAWISGNNIRKPLKIEKNQLYWNGEMWNIQWLGEYLGKEFRALIEKDEKYRLIYITHLEKNSLKVVFNQGVEYYRSILPEEKHNLLYGTWCDTQTNEWIIGFFDNIAVYQNQAWQYKIADQKEKNYTVQLQKNGKKKNLQIKLNETDSCKLTDGKINQQLFYSAKPKHYSYPDTTRFTDNGYKMDTVTISGYLQNVPNPETPFEISVPDILREKENRYYADIDDNGCFTIKFPVLNTTQIFIDFRRSMLIDVVEPGENYFLYINYTRGKNKWRIWNKSAWQMGDNARLHREIYAHKINDNYEFYPYYDEKDKIPDNYLNICNAIYQRRIEKLNQYIAKHPVQSERFKTFKNKYELFEFASYLMQRKFGLNHAEKERFSKAYMHIVDSIFKELPKPYTLSRDAATFIRDYIDYYDYILDNKISASNMEALALIIKKKLYNFTAKEKKSIIRTKQAFDLHDVLIEQKKDSAYIADKIAPYKSDIEYLTQTMSENKELDKLIAKEISYLFSNRRLDNEIQLANSIEMPQKLKDIRIVKYGLKEINRERTPLHDFEIKRLNNEIKNPTFKEILQQEQNKYIALQGQDITYIESLKRTEHLKKAKDADELFKKLTEPYLGKIIYIDFWGVWCGPCKMQMQHVGKVKEAMKDKDVIFMYFANRSPEESWKNVIKEYNLTGKNVVHYNLPHKQQKMLERRLSINSYPTYIVMDKTGKIVNMNPSRPMQTESLIMELNQYLQKK